MEKNLMAIKESEIKNIEIHANKTISSFIYQPSTKPIEDDKENSVKIAQFHSSDGSIQHTSSKVELTKVISNVTSDDNLLTDAQNHIVRTIRRGICIGSVMNENFSKNSELSSLKARNRESMLSNENERIKLRNLLNNSSVVTLFTFSNYVSFMLSNYMNDVDNLDLGIDIDTKEINFKDPLSSVEGAIWEYVEYLKRYAKDDSTLVYITKKFFDKLTETVIMRSNSMSDMEGFTRYNWKVESDNYEVSGFEHSSKPKSSKLEMTFVKPEEVVGNHIAKQQSMRLARQLVCYDPKAKKNPFVELGGFIFTYIGDGNPGTGKTTLIKMKAGLIDEYCKVAGYTFRYENFGTDQISSYQGQSGQNAKAFVNSVMDPNVIGYGTIDDIDQVAGKRGDKQSSSGQQEVTAVLMDAFAGANTVVRGNCSFGMFSNYPENVDDALRQRAGARFLIDGPQTLEDYCDILHILLGKNHTIQVGDHELFLAQKIQEAVKKSYEKFNRPTNEKLEDIFDKVIGNNKELTIASIGKYLKGIQELEPRFTGRAIKNITDSAKTRAMDFDIPDEWVESRDIFFTKEYDTKLNMIKELMQTITPEMLLQEINRYAESELRYSDKSFDEEVNKYVRQYNVQKAAEKLITNQ